MPLEDVTATPLPRLPAREADSHKGDYGRALLVGGSRNMSGAIALAAMATLRSGAGLVTVAVPRSIQGVVAGINPCYMTRGLADDDGHFSRDAWNASLGQEIAPTAAAVGPGIGRTDAVMEFVRFIFQAGDVPAVFDADALFALAVGDFDLSKRAAARVLTPHPGEFARLSKQPYQRNNRWKIAGDFVQQYSSSNGYPLVLVLKGHDTVITDGQRYAINHTGNPGMATGGTGDVLTGVITALLCQGLSPFDAARLGVHVHGLAGDLAAADLGQVSLIASDVVEYLPKAFRALGENGKDASV